MASLTPELHSWFSTIASGKIYPDTKGASLFLDTLHPQTGLCALMMAARNNQTKQLSWLLEQGADPLMVSRQRHWTALHFAVEGGHVEAAQLLLKKTPVQTTALVDKADALGRTALHYCIINDDMALTPAIRASLITLLLEAKADCERKDDEGATALHYCAIYGRTQEAEQLLAHGANPNARSHACELTPCHIAALEGHEVMAISMLHHGANAETKTAQGWSLKSRYPSLYALAQTQAMTAKSEKEPNHLAGSA